MCRRCGESDKRGSAHDRRARRVWLAGKYGVDGKAPCWWCDRLLTPIEFEVDRLAPGGRYARWNIVPSCPACNRARAYRPAEEGCIYG